MIDTTTLIIFTIVIIAIYVIKSLPKTIKMSEEDLRDIADKVVIITGANAGLGKEIAKKFAALNAHVILACRTERKAIEAVEEIKKESGNQKIEYMLLDLLSFDSIVSFAKRFKERSLPCHILMNNAGIMWLWEDKVNQPPMTRIGAEEYNTQFQANYLGHHLLTLSMLDVLMTSQCNIFNVSSSVHTLSSINIDNLTKNLSATFATYCQSKGCQIVSAYDLQRRIDAAGHLTNKATISSIHPGIFASEIVALPGPLKSLYHLIFKSASYCAKFIVQVAIDKRSNAKGGLYFDHGRATKSAGQTYDSAFGQQLYTRSLQLLDTHLKQFKNPLTLDGSW
ncbi:hypothetical protein DFA_08432 [Cavenderia fasciculata]|uniref:Short-chain dehydrogenase/reductase family protein n=1 Tax=Cavenderia fasciculata TaxID=261658 RepID=F4Q663_CACFS|nr:uncharacterized protein DFA_08432 [Cavenderia fasciculata]EGG17437.1 hypothetical protein DFA_08432 [Cavenderia fasciculata]|eukprot:XP_004355921.1 hypothetical protein DFA_08432 [Cavenderia fasciculata]